MRNKSGKKKFQPYPTRGLTLSDEVWKKLKAEKIKSGRTWNNFIKQFVDE